MTGRTHEKALARPGHILLFTVSCGEKIKPGTVEVKRQVVTGVTLAAVPSRRSNPITRLRGR